MECSDGPCKHISNSQTERYLSELVDNKLNFYLYRQAAFVSANHTLGIVKTTITTRSQAVAYKSFVEPSVEFRMCKACLVNKTDLE